MTSSGDGLGFVSGLAVVTVDIDAFELTQKFLHEVGFVAGGSGGLSIPRDLLYWIMSCVNSASSLEGG